MISRRRFVAFTASAIPLALVTRRADALAAKWIAGETEVLDAMAEAILPSELGADARRGVVRRFQRWVDEYKAGAEVTHGYGTSALRFTRPSMRPAWSATLERLGALKFGTMSIDDRRALIRDELKKVPFNGMPPVASAPHVALALLAFYYDSSEAADLCHHAQIGKQTCRPLAQSSRRPLPLMGGRS